MFFVRSVVSALFIAVVAGQTVTPCEQSCAVAAFAGSGCSDPNDLTCLCKSSFVSATKACLKSKCTAAEQAAGNAAAAKYCAAAPASSTKKTTTTKAAPPKTTTTTPKAPPANTKTTAKGTTTQAAPPANTQNTPTTNAPGGTTTPIVTPSAASSVSGSQGSGVAYFPPSSVSAFNGTATGFSSITLSSTDSTDLGVPTETPSGGAASLSVGLGSLIGTCFLIVGAIAFV